MASPKVALQLYTVRDVAEKDFVGTLKAVAQMGYRAVQMAGTFGLSAGELKKVLDDLGLTVAGTHVALDLLEDDLDREIAYYREIGTVDIVVPFLKPERRASADDYRQMAKSIGRLGARCKELGARLSYHNHALSSTGSTAPGASRYFSTRPTRTSSSGSRTSTGLRSPARTRSRSSTATPAAARSST